MAKTYQVVITPRAQASLQRIVDYLEEHESVSVAEKVLYGILDAIDTLAIIPNRNSIEETVTTEKRLFRRLMKWSYKIVYTVNEEKIEVVVVEIRHGKQDPQGLIDALK